jgi:uncharacterized protein with FMN-binding domain
VLTGRRIACTILTVSSRDHLPSEDRPVSRYLALALPVCLVAVLCGCAPGKGDIEKSLREEMNAKLNVEITSTSLTKQADGGYTGTATARNGDVYDVTVGPVKGGQFEWKAIAGQATVEKDIRAWLEREYKSKVKNLALTKQEPGIYKGTATLENGGKLNLSTYLEGTQMMYKADPVQ